MTEPLTTAEERSSSWCARAETSSSTSSPSSSRFDTTARGAGDPPRDEGRLQRALAVRLRAMGAEVDVWEPEPTGRGNRFVPDDLDFKGRPQLVARLAGSGGGRSLLLNGHIDAVTPGPLEDWTSDPFKAVVRDGHLWGRGATT